MKDKFTIKELKKVKSQTIYQLQNNIESRNSDTVLALEGLFEMGLVKKTVYGYCIPYDNVYKIPQFETWKRMRAYYQNTEGIYKPTNQKVAINRRSRQKTFRKLKKINCDEI